MATLNRGTAFGRAFSGAGSAGPRRLALMGGVAVVLFGVVGVMMMRGHHHPQSSSVSSLPDVNALPGGMHSNNFYNKLATQQAQQTAAVAASKGQSSVAPMPAGQPAETSAPPVVAVTPATPAVRPVPPAHTLAPTPVAYTSPPVAQQTPSPSPQDKQQGQAYAAAVGSLLAGWGSGPAPVTQVYIDPSKDTGGVSGGQGGVHAQGAAVGGMGAGSAPRTEASLASASGGAQGTVLIPAGKGIYARTKLEADSDSGGPVVVTAESGPIAGDDMTGTFTRHGDRLVVELNSITLQDGSQQTIDALLIAPDSMETAVASSVDEHYISRFVLPVAAAFVAGLGQAIEQSNATVAVSPLGGYTSQNNLNFNQQLGVAAGAAGSQLQKLFLENAPNGPTVKLAAGANVGVIFLKPLTEAATP